tara:strand:+ start:304 stop:618 length:315 start_codon:yes stop_codon:yes gene_type:complete
MYGSMMDYMKQYPGPSKKVMKENLLNDTIGYRQKELKNNKKVKQIATKLLNNKKNKPKNLSDYSIFIRVRLRDTFKSLIDKELDKKKTKRRKKVKTKRKKTKHH